MSNYVRFKGNNPFGSQAKMLYHLDRVNEYLQTGDTSPVFAEFNLTDVCNLQCKWCISENCKSKDTIDSKTAAKFLHNFREIGGKAVTFSGGGEPTLHPQFESFVPYAAMLMDVGLMTNGWINPYHIPIVDKYCRWVRVSLDTTDPDLYRQWKGNHDVEKVLQNIEALKYTKVGVNVNVCSEHTIEDVERTIKTLKDKVAYIQFRPVLPRYFKQEPIALNYRVWDYLKLYYSSDPKVNLSDDKFLDLMGEELFPFSSCEGHFFNPVVQANGDVSVCMYHPRDPDFVFGNLYENSFQEIWTSERRQQVIEKVRTVDYREKCQACCKLTELNRFIDFIRFQDPASDVNFL